MSIWNKILVGLIGVAAVAFLFMAMWTLKTRQVWAECAQKHEQRLKQVAAENEKLAEGIERDGQVVEPGIRQSRKELHKLLLARRRAWFHCEPKIKVGEDDGTAEVTVSIDQPAPHGIAPQTVLYAFEESDAEKKGQYLGEFAVANVADKKATLIPTAILTPREIERLQKLSRKKQPWVLYEILPQDNRELFAGLSDEQKKAMLPSGSLSEYLKDGKPAAADDPKDRVVDGKYVRPILDFAGLFNREQRKRTLLSDSIDAAKWDRQLLDGALAAARAQEEACVKEIVATKETKKEAVRQRDAVAEHGKKIEEKRAALQALAARLIETNQAMAGQIAKFQLEAARRIDARTRAMAQSGTERR